jgi:nucleoside 2-deoxyribosyltransferase
MSRRIYLAARFSRKDELAGYKSDLERAGLIVSSRWLTGAHDWSGTDDDEIPEAALVPFAIEDLEDIDACDILVAFLETPDAGYMSGGRHVELGYALGRGKSILTVGERPENVFHAGMDRVTTWPEALSALTRAIEPAAPAVSDAAVEAALATFWTVVSGSDREDMRAAIEAALVVIRAEEGE